jgi:hypothetical protein
MAMTSDGRLSAANRYWGRVRDPVAALSGSHPKAPGFAGGYLLSAAPCMGLPCPVTAREGASNESKRTDSRALSHSSVKYIGGPCSSGSCRRTAQADSWAVVIKASPAIRVRSASRQNDTWPTLWPGVCIQRHPGMPGIAASESDRRREETSTGDVG